MDDQYRTLGDLADEAEATTGKRPTRAGELIDLYVDRGRQQHRNDDAFLENLVTPPSVRDLDLTDISADDVNDLVHPDLVQLIEHANSIDKNLQLGKYAASSEYPEEPEDPEEPEQS